MINEIENLKNAEIFSICLNGIAELLIFLIVPAWIQLINLQSTSPFFNFEANDSFPNRSPVTASIHSLASLSSVTSYFAA